jgi:hypothetical protein
LTVWLAHLCDAWPCGGVRGPARVDQLQRLPRPGRGQLGGGGQLEAPAGVDGVLTHAHHKSATISIAIAFQCDCKPGWCTADQREEINARSAWRRLRVRHGPLELRKAGRLGVGSGWARYHQRTHTHQDLVIWRQLPGNLARHHLPQHHPKGEHVHGRGERVPTPVFRRHVLRSPRPGRLHLLLRAPSAWSASDQW